MRFLCLKDGRKNIMESSADDLATDDELAAEPPSVAKDLDGYDAPAANKFGNDLNRCANDIYFKNEYDAVCSPLLLVVCPRGHPGMIFRSAFRLISRY